MDFSKFNKNKKDFFKNILFGAVVAALTVVAVLILCAAVMLVFNVPNAFSSPLSSVSVAIGTFVGSYVSALRRQKNGMLTGLATAGVLLVLIAAVGIIVALPFSAISFIRTAIVLCSGVIGGILGVNKNTVRKII